MSSIHHHTPCPPSPPHTPCPGHPERLLTGTQTQTLTGLGWGLLWPRFSITGLMKTIIACFVALLGVTNWLILGRPFEDEKPGITHRVEGMHLPQSGPESAENDLPPAVGSAGLGPPGSPLKVSAGWRGVASTWQAETRPRWPWLCGPLLVRGLPHWHSHGLTSLQRTLPLKGSTCPRIAGKMVFPGHCSGKMPSSQLTPTRQWPVLLPIGEGELGQQWVALWWAALGCGVPGWGIGVFPSSLAHGPPQPLTTHTSPRKRKWQQEQGTRSQNKG